MSVHPEEFRLLLLIGIKRFRFEIFFISYGSVAQSKHTLINTVSDIERCNSNRATIHQTQLHLLPLSALRLCKIGPARPVDQGWRNPPAQDLPTSLVRRWRRYLWSRDRFEILKVAPIAPILPHSTDYRLKLENYLFPSSRALSSTKFFAAMKSKCEHSRLLSPLSHANRSNINSRFKKINESFGESQLIRCCESLNIFRKLTFPRSNQVLKRQRLSRVHLLAIFIVISVPCGVL